MKIKNIFIIIAALTIGITACKKEKYEIEYTPIKDLSGEWWVTSSYVVSGTSTDTLGHWKLTTSNTASYTQDSILVTDRDNMFSWNISAGLNFDAKTFSVSNTYDHYTPSRTVSISNGQIIKDGGITPGGTITDSIYMEVLFSNHPDTTYVISGVRRTGFLEDEY